MIGQILRISTIFANLMLTSALALAITIGVAGTIERTSSSCYACLHATLFKAPPASGLHHVVADTGRATV